MEQIIEKMKSLVKTKMINNNMYKVLFYNHETELAGDYYDLSRKLEKNCYKVIQLLALENDIIPERYLDNVVNIGIEAQLKLLQSTVAVVGIGRLGSHIVENLVRLGVGKIILVDASNIDYKSLNSQLIATPEYLNVNRSIVMSLRIRDVNMGVEVEAVDKHINKKNVHDLLEEAHIVVSSSNNEKTHELLSSYCKEKEKVFVYGTLDGWNGYVASITPDSKDFKHYSQLIEKSCNAGSRRTALSFGVAIVAGCQTAEIVHILSSGESKYKNQLMKLDILNTKSQLIDI